MKSLRAIFAAVALLIMSVPASAQEIGGDLDDDEFPHIEIGVQVNPVLTMDDFIQNTTDFGLTLDWRIPALPWAVGTGITYAPRTEAYGYDPVPEGMTRRREYTVVQFPLQLGYRLFERDNFTPYIYAGLSGNFLTGYTYSRTQDEGVPGPPAAPEFLFHYKITQLHQAGYKPFHYGYVFGISGLITLYKDLYLGIDTRVRFNHLTNSQDTYLNQDFSSIGLQVKLSYNIKGFREE